MKRYFLVPVCLTVLLMIAIAVKWYSASPWSEASAKSTPTQTASDMPVATMTPYDPENLIAYPGARGISHQKLGGGDWASLSYTTTAPLQDVVTFYDRQLRGNGWVFQYGPKEVTSMSQVTSMTPWDSIAYMWTDPAHKLAWDLKLVIGAVQPPYSGSTDTTYMQVSLLRQPDLDALPLASDATQVQTTWKPSVRWAPNYEKDITYHTHESLDDLTKYYKSLLPQAGWGGPSEALAPGDLNDNILTGIKFGWGTGGIEDLTYVGLIVIATKTDNSETVVQLKLDNLIPN